MIKYPMTVQGARALEEELHHLTKVVRPKLSQDIGTARELGDLKENAEYHAAREQQGMVEARVRDIEGRLQNSVVIDVTTIAHTGTSTIHTTCICPHSASCWVRSTSLRESLTLFLTHRLHFFLHSRLKSGSIFHRNRPSHST